MNIELIPLQVNRKHADRYLVIVDLSIVSAALGEPVTVFYSNNMEPGAVAGNHYHRNKREAFRAAHGRFEIALVHVESGERRSMFLDSDPESPDFSCLVVPIGVAHAVRNVSTTVARLDVFATNKPRALDDDFPFSVLP